MQRKKRRAKRNLGFETVEAREALTNLLPIDAAAGDVGVPAETSSVDGDTIPPDGDSTIGGGG